MDEDMVEDVQRMMGSSWKRMLITGAVMGGVALALPRRWRTWGVALMTFGMLTFYAVAWGSEYDWEAMRNTYHWTPFVVVMVTVDVLLLIFNPIVTGRRRAAREAERQRLADEEFERECERLEAERQADLDERMQYWRERLHLPEVAPPAIHGEITYKRS